jgi:hypothetical protein
MKDCGSRRTRRGTLFAEMIDWEIETVLDSDVVDLLLDILWRWRSILHQSFEGRYRRGTFHFDVTRGCCWYSGEHLVYIRRRGLVFGIPRQRHCGDLMDFSEGGHSTGNGLNLVNMGTETW